ncbi:MAG TPA: LysR family transcriptional regulator [Anaeromyxobacteraceae bacterium]|nr:LysR family transcriptional regulator [Anaeromyxobacteraceae bacterium]
MGLGGERRGGRPRAEALLRAVASWDDIRFFLAVHRAGSLSAAAVPLGVTQPTCGRRIAALEASLGVRLFERFPDGLRITREGAALLDAAIRMEQGAHDLALRAAVEDGDLEGVVRIGTTELLACAFLVGALPRVRERYPGIRVELALSNEESDLLGREVDVAIRFRPQGARPTPGALVARRLGDEAFGLYGTDAYLRRRGAPADPRVLAHHDVVVYSGRHPASEWCASAFRGAVVVLSAPSMQVTAAAIAAGLGLGVIPARAARLWPQLRPISPPVAHGTGWLVVHPDLRRVPRIRVVVDALASLFRSGP